MIELTLYVREECGLCDEMRAGIDEEGGGAVRLRIVDVDGSPARRRRFGDRVPVLVHEGEVVCFGRLDRSRLRALLSD